MESHNPGKNPTSRSINRRQWLRATAAVTAGSFLLATRANACAWLHRQDNSPNVQTENVQYPSGDAKLNAFVAKPASGGLHSSLVLIHDDAGLNGRAIETARDFAEAGFFTFAPDLLSRSGGVAQFQSANQIAEALNHLSPDQTADDLRAGYSYLRTKLNPDAAASAVGFGWGGWRTFVLAAKVSGLARAVVYSGSTPTTGLHEIDTNFLAHYGQYDFRLAGNALWVEKELGKRFTYSIYPGVDHGFYDDSSPQFNADAAKLAWSRTLEFLRAV
jgi:carboxymethylenebutenolidase